MNQYETQQKISWNEDSNKCYLDTVYYKNGIRILSSEEITPEQAAEFTARTRF